MNIYKGGIYMTERKKMTKAERKKYFLDNYRNYTYNAPYDPRDEGIYDNTSELYDIYGTFYPTNDTNTYPQMRAYKGENK